MKRSLHGVAFDQILFLEGLVLVQFASSERSAVAYPNIVSDVCAKHVFCAVAAWGPQADCSPSYEIAADRRGLRYAQDGASDVESQRVALSTLRSSLCGLSQRGARYGRAPKVWIRYTLITRIVTATVHATALIEAGALRMPLEPNLRGLVELPVHIDGAADDGAKEP